MNDNIAVSIICNAYNHEEYIRDALESFVMQKTNFKFEALVHDDASTDKTADIIREYEKKYPDIIKPIYQTENQYSKNVAIGIKYQFPRAKGKYIAVCEGDDYWIDPYKLQKQFNAMEKHPELDVCTHSSMTIDAKSGEILEYTRPSRKNGIIPVEKVINGGGGFVSTNSLFYRAEINKNIPEFRKYLCLDYTVQIHSSLRGGMLYINDCMSAYRYMVQGSWTQRMKADEKKTEEHNKKVTRMLEILNRETQYRYSKTINLHIMQNKSQDVYNKVLNKQHLEASDYEIVKASNIKWKIKIFMHLKLPKLTQTLKEVKRSLRK